MMDGARALLIERGAVDIREERFHSPSEARTAALPDLPIVARMRVRGRDHVVRVEPGQTLLEAGLAAGAALPFSCAMGGCGACKARLVSGEVHADEPSCLSAREREAGFVLTCSSRPISPLALEVP
jgi:ring-1,2-phenylacetyl-CoA epoxidase subunit PaaE